MPYTGCLSIRVRSRPFVFSVTFDDGINWKASFGKIWSKTRKDDIRIDYADYDNSLIHECTITADEYMDDMFKAMACYRENRKVDLEWSPETNDSSKDMKTSVQTVDAGST